MKPKPRRVTFYVGSFRPQSSGNRIVDGCVVIEVMPSIFADLRVGFLTSIKDQPYRVKEITQHVVESDIKICIVEEGWIMEGDA